MKKAIILAVAVIFVCSTAFAGDKSKAGAQSSAAKNAAKTVPGATTKAVEKKADAPCISKDGKPCVPSSGASSGSSGSNAKSDSGKPKEEKKKEEPKASKGKINTKVTYDKLVATIQKESPGEDPVAVMARSLTLYTDIKNILSKKIAENALKTLQMLDKGEIPANLKFKAEKYVHDVIYATFYGKSDAVVDYEAKIMAHDTAIVAALGKKAGWKNVNENVIKLGGQPMMTPLMHKQMLEKMKEEAQEKQSGSSGGNQQKPKEDGSGGGGGGGGSPSQGKQAAGQTVGECESGGGGDSGPGDNKTDYMPSDEMSKAAKGMQGGAGDTADPYMGDPCVSMMSNPKGPGGGAGKGGEETKLHKELTKVMEAAAGVAYHAKLAELWTAEGNYQSDTSTDGSKATEAWEKAAAEKKKAEESKKKYDQAVKNAQKAKATESGIKTATDAGTESGQAGAVGDFEKAKASNAATPTWEGESGGGGGGCDESAADALMDAYNNCIKDSNNCGPNLSVFTLLSAGASASKGESAPVDPPDEGGNTGGNTTSASEGDCEGSSGDSSGGQSTEWLTSSTGQAVTDCGLLGCGQDEPTGGVLGGTDPIAPIQTQTGTMNKGGSANEGDNGGGVGSQGKGK